MSTEQIERLMNNDLGFYALPVEDQMFMRSLNPLSDLVERGNGHWADGFGGPIYNNKIYRIHKNYKPAQPKFPGMVLCEVRNPHARRFIGYKSQVLSLSEVADYSCTGYNYLEAPDRLWDSPVAFVDDEGSLHVQLTDNGVACGWKPATLVAVAFAEEKCTE